MATVIQNLFVMAPLLLSMVSSIYISIAVVAIGLKKISASRLRLFRKYIYGTLIIDSLWVVASRLVTQILIYGGKAKMSSAELVFKIAKVMHWSSIAFIVVAVIVVVVTVYAAVTKEGNIAELKKLFRDCIVVAIILWILAWLIV